MKQMKLIKNNDFTNARLICGDCNKLLKNLSTNSVDHVDIDIPYHVQMRGGNDNAHYNTKTISSIRKMGHGINVSKMFSQLIRIEKHINMAVWCSKDQIDPIKDYIKRHVNNVNWELVEWQKTDPIAFNHRTWDRDVEYCLIVYQKHCDLLHGNFQTKPHCYLAPSNNDRKKFGIDHPTIKPLFMVRNIIYSMTNPGDTVLDCFMGSGTSGVACKMLDRNYIGIELVKKYYRIAVKRIRQSSSFAQKMINYEISRTKQDNFTYHLAMIADQRIKNDVRQTAIAHHFQVQGRLLHHRLVQHYKHNLNTRRYVARHHHYHNLVMHREYVRRQKNNPRSKYYQGNKTKLYQGSLVDQIQKVASHSVALLLAIGTNNRTLIKQYERVISDDGMIIEVMTNHAIRKPIKLLRNLIVAYTNQGDIVLDTAMGMGNVGIASVYTRRSFIGIERNQHRFVLAKKRIDRFKNNFGIIRHIRIAT